MEHSYRSCYEIAGSTGRLVIDRAFAPPPAYQPALRIERQDHREEIVLRADDQFANMIAFFVAAVRTGAGVDASTEASLAQARLAGAAAAQARLITVLPGSPRPARYRTPLEATATIVLTPAGRPAATPSQ